MKKYILISAISLFIFNTGFSQDLGKRANDLLNDAKKTVTGNTSTKTPLSNDEVIKGLKEALTVGTNN